MKVSLPMTLALAMTAAEARRYQSAAPASSGRVATSALPRDLESSFDLVSEILSSGPMHTLANTLLKQQPNAGAFTMPSSTASAPRYAVSTDSETGDVTLRVELPGVAAQDLEVTLEDDRLLRIQGKRNLLSGQVMEFDQSFQLDKEVDASSLQVTLQNGLLQVTASKKVKTVQRLSVQTTTAPTESNKATVPIESTEQTGDPQDVTIAEE